MKSDTYQAVGNKNKMEQGTRVIALSQEFKVDDSVQFLNFGSGRQWMKGTITRQLGAVNFEVEAGGGLVRRHADQL